ncbi:MAG: BatA domain-containing protein [Bacteroidia bacterium]
MSFVYPEFLFALSALSIPVFVHLFNFRRFVTVYFSNVQFLREVKIETQSRSRLKHLLVLATRLLTIACLVLAFAQPFIPAKNSSANTPEGVASIFVDNSFSMEAKGTSGTMLDDARNKAKEIASAFPPSQKFQLLTNDFEGHQQRLVNREEFLELLEEVKISPSVKTLSEIYSRQKDALKSQGNAGGSAYIISDFQKSVSNIEEIKADSGLSCYFIPVTPAQSNNLYIDSCWFSTPIRQLNRPEELKLRIKNNSGEDYENIPVKLILNGTQKALASFSVAAQSETEVPLSFTLSETGLQLGELSITDYPVTYDDKFFFTFNVAKNIPVLCINGKEESKSINSLFVNDPYFILDNQNEKSVNYASLPNYSLVVANEITSVSSGLAQELKRFAQAGGSVLIIPAQNSDISSYNELLLSLEAGSISGKDSSATKVGSINYQSEIFANVFEKKKEKQNLDLPIVSKHYIISKNTKTREEILIRLNNGESFLSKYSSGKGYAYLLSVSLSDNFSNFSRHAIFVPTLYNIALFSQPSRPLFQTIGKEQSTEFANSNIAGESVYRITSTDNKFEIIPEQKIIGPLTSVVLGNQLKEAGNYLLKAKTDTLFGLSFNYDRKESVLQYLSTTELESMANKAGSGNFSVVETNNKSLAITLTELNEGIKLWKWFVWLTLAFIVSEVLLIRLLK